MKEPALATIERSGPPRRRFHFYRGWWIVAAGFFAQIVNTAAHGWVLSILIRPMEQDLSWSRSELVAALTLAAIVTGVISAPLGPLVDRYGARLLMTGSLFLMGACLVLLGFITDLWLYYLLLGVGVGLATPGMQALGPTVAIANWFIRRRTMALTFYMFGTSITGIAVVPAFAWIEAYSGWRVAWIVLGAMTWAIIPLAWFSIRRRPEELGLLPDGDDPGAVAKPAVVVQKALFKKHLELVERYRLGVKPEVAVEGAPSKHGDESPWTVREAFRTRTFWLLVVAFALVAFPLGSIFVHMSPYVTGKGFSAAEGAFTLSVYGFGTLAGRPVWGYIVNRFGVHRSLAGYGFAYGLALFAFAAPSSLWGIGLATFALGIAVAGGILLQTQSFADYFGRDIVGSLIGYSGLILTAPRSLSPLLSAFAYDTMRSYTFVFSAFAVACLIAGVAFLLAPPPVHPSVRGRQLQKQQAI